MARRPIRLIWALGLSCRLRVRFPRDPLVALPAQGRVGRALVAVVEPDLAAGQGPEVPVEGHADRVGGGLDDGSFDRRGDVVVAVVDPAAQVVPEGDARPHATVGRGVGKEPGRVVEAHVVVAERPVEEDARAGFDPGAHLDVVASEPAQVEEVLLAGVHLVGLEHARREVVADADHGARAQRQLEAGVQQVARGVDLVELGEEAQSHGVVGRELAPEEGHVGRRRGARAEGTGPRRGRGCRAGCTRRPRSSRGCWGAGAPARSAGPRAPNRRRPRPRVPLPGRRWRGTGRGRSRARPGSARPRGRQPGAEAAVRSCRERPPRRR